MVRGNFLDVQISIMLECGKIVPQFHCGNFMLCDLRRMGFTSSLRGPAEF